MRGLAYIPGVQVEVSAELEAIQGSEPTAYEAAELYASVAIPRSYVRELCEQQHPREEPAKLAKSEMQLTENECKIRIERFVQNNLPGLALGEDEYRQV